MTVPSGNKGCIFSLHAPRLNRHVLENFIERGPEVDVTVGIRRSIVEDETPPLPCYFLMLCDLDFLSPNAQVYPVLFLLRELGLGMRSLGG